MACHRRLTSSWGSCRSHEASSARRCHSSTAANIQNTCRCLVIVVAAPVRGSALAVMPVQVLRHHSRSAPKSRSFRCSAGGSQPAVASAQKSSGAVVSGPIVLDGTGGAAQSPPTTPTVAPASKSVPAVVPVPAPASAALATPAAAAPPTAVRQEQAPAAAPKQGPGAVAPPKNDAAKPAQAPAHTAPASEPMATAVDPAQLNVPTPTASKGEPAPTAEKPTQPQASGPAPASREPTTAVPTPTVQPARAEIPAAGRQPQTSGPTPSSGEPAPTAGPQPTGPTLGPGRGGADSGQRLAVFEDRAPPARRPVPGTTSAGATSTHAVLTLPPGRGPVAIPGVTSPSKPAPVRGGQARGAGAAAASRGGLGLSPCPASPFACSADFGTLSHLVGAACSLWASLCSRPTHGSTMSPWRCLPATQRRQSQALCEVAWRPTFVWPVAADLCQLHNAVLSHAGMGDVQVPAQGAKRHSADDGNRGAKRQRLQSESHILPCGVTSLQHCSGSEAVVQSSGRSLKH